MFELGGDVVSPQLADNLMKLIAEGAGEEDEQADTELRAQAVRSYLDLLHKPHLSPVLLKVCLHLLFCLCKLACIMQAKAASTPLALHAGRSFLTAASIAYSSIFCHILRTKLHLDLCSTMLQKSMLSYWSQTLSGQGMRY